MMSFCLVGFEHFLYTIIHKVIYSNSAYSVLSGFFYCDHVRQTAAEMGSTFFQTALFSLHVFPFALVPDNFNILKQTNKN